MTIENSKGPEADLSWPRLVDYLCRHFAATAQDRCVLWVDPARVDPFEENELVEQARVRVPIRHPRFDPIHAPYLVPLDLSRSVDTDVLRSSVELAWHSWTMDSLNAMQGQPICGWIRTDADIDAVGRHWGRHCHLHTVQGQSKLLRFQDPCVREWLWPTLNDTQQQAMMGAVDEVLALGRAQQVIRHVASRANFSDTQASAASVLQLDQNQWAQLDDYATLHAAWLTWRNAIPSDILSAQPSGWEAPILRALAHATSLGVRDDIDRELFALHALQLGPNFHQDPKLCPVWKQTQAGEFYGSAVEETIGCPADQLGTSAHVA